MIPQEAGAGASGRKGCGWETQPNELSGWRSETCARHFVALALSYHPRNHAEKGSSTLDELVEAGKFREDLYQRLNVFRIQVPPLRERPKDIEVQARHFLALHQGDRPEPIRDFGPRVLEALRRLPWEGNTRQLENLIRELIAHQDRGPVLQLEDLPRWMLEQLAGPMPARPEPDVLQELAERACRDKLSWNVAVEQYERGLLQTVLKQHGGNRTRTAAELGVTPRRIFNKLKKYQLDQSYCPFAERRAA